MYGVRGRRFDDRTAGTDVLQGHPRTLSEYGGGHSEDGYVSARVEKDLADEARERGTGIMAALGAGMRRLRGGPDQDEIAAARRLSLETMYSTRRDHWVAKRFATELAGRPNSEIIRNLPEMADVVIPVQRDLRWVAIATAAVNVVHGHVDAGQDHALGAELGRATRLASVERVVQDHSSKRREDMPLATRLSQMTTLVAGEVHNMLSTGQAIDDAVGRRAAVAAERDGMGAGWRVKHLEDRMSGPAPKAGSERVEWMREAFETERAMARAGLLEPRRVVEAAQDLALAGGLSGKRHQGVAYRQPDAQARRLPPQEQERLLEQNRAEIRRHKDGPPSNILPDRAEGEGRTASPRHPAMRMDQGMGR